MRRAVGTAILSAAMLALDASAQCVDEAMAPELRALLEARDFPALDVLLTEAEDAYLEDFRKEDAYDSLIEEFDRSEAWLTAPLDAWVDASGSAMAYLARGIHRERIGWYRRGCGLANETSDEQFAGMRAQFALALEDYSKVVELKPEQTHVYMHVIGIFMNFSADAEMDRAYEKALSVNPRSFTVRAQYLRAVSPRWGGSFEQMEAVVAEASRYYGDNPRLKELEARVHAEYGYVSTRAQDWPDTVKHYTAALAVKEECDYYEERGNAYLMSRLYEPAADDFSESIRLCPTDMTGYDFRGRVKYYAGDFEGAVADLTYAIDHGRELARTYQTRGDAYIQLRSYPEAKADLDHALEIDPASDDEYYRGLRDFLRRRFEYEAACAADPRCVLQ